MLTLVKIKRKPLKKKFIFFCFENLYHLLSGKIISNHNKTKEFEVMYGIDPGVGFVI